MAMDNRFSRLAEDARRSGRKLAGLFLTNGFPDLQACRDILPVIDEAGADFIELGMPFSDPLAEGLPIQRSSARALANGVRMTDTLRTAEIFRSRSDTPLFLMGYVNPVLSYGASNFFRDARSCGVDGIILPDLPPGASSEIADSARDNDLGLVHLIAPNTADTRMRLVDEHATSFVYAVSVTGLTGSAVDAVGAVQEYLQRARREVRKNPLLVGFGITNAAEAESLSRHTDGFIVGSALINRVEQLWDDTSLSQTQRLDAVGSFVRSLTARTPADAA